MKTFYTLFLVLIFSSRIFSLEMTCPYGCEKDPELYWEKQSVLTSFLSQGYPERKCEFHVFTYDEESYCYRGDILSWYTIKWASFPKWKHLQDHDSFLNQLTIQRFLKINPGVGDEVLNQQDKYFHLKDLAGFLNILSQLQSDADVYTASEKACFNEALRWYEASLKYFQGLSKPGIHGCCFDGLFYESLDKRLTETQHNIEKYKNKIKELQVQTDHLQNKLNEARNEILQLHEDQYQNCLTNHQWTGTYYNRGLLNFYRGQISEAFDDIRQFMNGLKESEKRSAFI